jgi:hypothetical protein
MWQTVLNSVYKNNFDILEPVLKKKYNVNIDSPREAAEGLALIIGEQLRTKNFTGVSEIIRYYLESPYVDRQTFAEWTAFEILKSPETEKLYFYIVEPYCKPEKILNFKQLNIS